MHHKTLPFEGGFHIQAGTERSQAAAMTLSPGGSTGSSENRHPESDQWLFVAGGTGEAIVEGEHVALQPGSLLLIEAGEAHEIHCTGQVPLETVNVYAPPVY